MAIFAASYRSAPDPSAGDEVADLDLHNAAAAQLAVDHQIKEDSVPQLTLVVEPEADGPNLLRRQCPFGISGASGVACRAYAGDRIECPIVVLLRPRWRVESVLPFARYVALELGRKEIGSFRVIAKGKPPIGSRPKSARQLVSASSLKANDPPSPAVGKGRAAVAVAGLDDGIARPASKLEETVGVAVAVLLQRARMAVPALLDETDIAPATLGEAGVVALALLADRAVLEAVVERIDP